MTDAFDPAEPGNEDAEVDRWTPPAALEPVVSSDVPAEPLPAAPIPPAVLPPAMAPAGPLTVLQLGCGGVAVAILALLASMVWLVSLMPDSDLVDADQRGMALYAAALAFSAALGLPSLWYAGLRLARRPARAAAWQPGRALQLATLAALTVLPAALLGGHLVFETEWAGLLLPVFHVLATSIPVVWVVAFSLNRLPAGSPQRVWGTLSAGLMLGPSLILLLEMVAMVVGVVGVMVYVATQPALVAEMDDLVTRLQIGATSPAMIERIVAPYISNPWVIAATLAYIALLVPLIEELFKPVGMWLLAGRKLSPTDGFVLGVLSGAGFALFENLLLSINPTAWIELVVARIGTGALHIAATGLVGYGLALAWNKGGYLRLMLAYLLAVTLHGVWNGLTILMTFAFASDAAPALVKMVGPTAVVVLPTLSILCLGLLWLTNRRLRAELAPALEPAALTN